MGKRRPAFAGFRGPGYYIWALGCQELVLVRNGKKVKWKESKKGREKNDNTLVW